MKPPAWLPWLGPPMAGMGAGLTAVWLQGGFWPALAGALIVGFIPVAVYRLWKWTYERKA